MLYRMKLVANCPLCGDYGHVITGQTFEALSDVGQSLITRGLASPYIEPQPSGALAEMLAQMRQKTAEPAESKMIAPPENKMMPVPENKEAAPPLDLQPESLPVQPPKRGRGRPRIVR